MPGLDAHAGARVLQRFVLQPRSRKADPRAICEQLLLVRRYEVCHWTPAPNMPMHPEAAIHRVDHPFTTRGELAIQRLFGHVRIPRFARDDSVARDDTNAWYRASCRRRRCRR